MRVHLLDGTYELFRAYFGAPSAIVDGREVGRARAGPQPGQVAARRRGATHAAVAFDHVIESFRNRLFAGYKTGDGLDPALASQFELAEDASAARSAWRPGR
ncbi:MAG: hypothetical protein R2939_19475 [Kofleriaceae bacterium]